MDGKVIFQLFIRKYSSLLPRPELRDETNQRDHVDLSAGGEVGKN